MSEFVSIAVHQSRSNEIRALLEATPLPVTLVPFDDVGAFLYVCDKVDEIGDARNTSYYGDALVSVILSAKEDTEAALEKGADRILFRGDSAGLLLMLRECVNTWQRAVHFRHRRLATDAVLSHMSESVEITSPAVRIEYVNPAFESRTGYTAAEVLGKTPAQLMRSTGHSEKLFQSIEDTSKRGEVWHGEFLSHGRSGEDDYILASIIPILDHRKKLVKIASLKQSLSATAVDNNALDGGRSALLSLLKSEERYRNLVDAADDCLIVSDYESGQILNANLAALESFSYSLAELRRMSIRMLSPDSEQEKIDHISQQIVGQGWATATRVRMCRKDGSWFWAMTRYRVFKTQGQTCYLSVMRDISDEIEKEQQLRDANKKLLHGARLAAVGRLAAGVAHEINNPATFVKLNLEFIEEFLGELPNPEAPEVLEGKEAISDALVGINRIESVTQQLLGFTRITQSGKKNVCLRKLMEFSLRLVRNEIHHRARLELVYDDIPWVFVEEDRIGQLFTNLLVNAAHAISPGNKSKNTILIEMRERKGVIIIRIGDTGCGMSDEIQRRIFEPFFTTKKAGEGTGLGLALCSETVTSHGGTLTVDSKLGVGTTAEIRLPLAKNRHQSDDDAPPTPEPIAIDSATSLRVLLIDDDSQILTVYRRALEKHWDLVLAEGGESALEILKQDHAFDLILCDLMMPNVDGFQVFKHLAQFHPQLAKKLVFCTAGAFTDQTKLFLETCDVPVLHKPVSQRALLGSFRLLDKE